MADDPTPAASTDEVLLHAPAPETTYGKETGIEDGTVYASDKKGLISVWARHVEHLLTRGFTRHDPAPDAAETAPVAPVTPPSPAPASPNPAPDATDPDDEPATKG
jgi:hypothetical protein